MLRTKIVCTIGPASREPAILEALIKAGMDVARLNMSHGDVEYHRENIRLIRQLSEQLKKPVAILTDHRLEPTCANNAPVGSSVTLTCPYKILISFSLEKLEAVFPSPIYRLSFGERIQHSSLYALV